MSEAGRERIERVQRILNPKDKSADPLTNLRDLLVNRGQKHRGGPAQVEFLEAVESNALLEYLAKKGVGQEFASFGTSVLPVKLQEPEFAKAPVSTARRIRNTYRSLSPQEASSVSVWNVITLHNIQEERLEAPYLAASSDRSSGRQRIQKALQTKNRKQIDDCVRTVFRTMGGLHRVRGYVSVISDCTLSRYWWMGQVIENTATDNDRVWEELNRFWAVIAEYAMRRLTIVGNPVLMHGLITQITSYPVDTNDGLQEVLKRMGVLFSEVSAHSWSKHEVQNLLTHGVPV